MTSECDREALDQRRLLREAKCPRHPESLKAADRVRRGSNRSLGSPSEDAAKRVFVLAGDTQVHAVDDVAVMLRQMRMQWVTK